MRKKEKERRGRREEGGGGAREACGAKEEEEGGGEGGREREKGVQSSISLYPQICPLVAPINQHSQVAMPGREITCIIRESYLSPCLY